MADFIAQIEELRERESRVAMATLVVTKKDGSRQTETIKDIWWRGVGGDCLICRIEKQTFVREEDEDE